MTKSPQEISDGIKGILQRTAALPEAAESPRSHYQFTTDAIIEVPRYLIKLAALAGHDDATLRPHLEQLYGMALERLIEAFERYLKEVAAACVDQLVGRVIDDRFNGFLVQGSTIASHFGAGSPGKALCESSVWLDCDEINNRFRKLLANPFATGTFYLFPRTGNQQPPSEHWRYDVMALLWQLRHASIHNVGVLTQSDAVKLRVLAGRNVNSPAILTPNETDLDWLKLFLDDTVNTCNQRVGERLAELLTSIHATTPLLVDPPTVAAQLVDVFQVPLTVATVAAVPNP